MDLRLRRTTLRRIANLTDERFCGSFKLFGPDWTAVLCPTSSVPWPCTPLAARQDRLCPLCGVRDAGLGSIREVILGREKGSHLDAI